MQGYSHALTGASAWLAVTSSASITLPVDMHVPDWIPDWLPFVGETITNPTIPLGANLISASPETALVGAILGAGAALAADMDHHSGTIAHSLPPLTGIACRGVSAISGGHRHGTHSLVGIAVFTLLTWLASFLTIDVDGRTVALGAGLVAVPLVAFALKGLGVRLGRGDSLLNTFLGPWIVSVGTAGLATYYLDYQWTWLPLAMGIGVFVHILGDMLTTQGVPWLWPLNPKPPKAVLKTPALGSLVKIVWQQNGYFRFAVLGDTTSFREGVFAAFVAVHVTAALFMATIALAGA